jgi:hypothetical protein
MRRRRYRVLELVFIGIASVMAASGVVMRIMHGPRNVATILTAGGVLTFMILQIIFNAEVETAHINEVRRSNILEREVDSLETENENLRSKIDRLGGHPPGAV